MPRRRAIVPARGLHLTAEERSNHLRSRRHDNREFEYQVGKRIVVCRNISGAPGENAIHFFRIGITTNGTDESLGTD